MEIKAIVEKGLPPDFCARMRALMTEKEYQAFLSSYGQERSFSLRINPLKTDRDHAVRLLQAACDRLWAESGSGIPAEKGELEKGELSEQDLDPDQGLMDGMQLHPVAWEEDGFYYPEALHPGRLPWHEAGMYYIQEASAMVPAVLCGVQPGERVLDLCAAPGGKSTKLAACLQGRGILVANEIHPERARVLASNLERMGVRNALVTCESPQKLASRFPLFFDRIVVDAPCSGEGMFRKEEEALAHWSLDNIHMCAERQQEILEEAAAMLRPGGRLVYSTCTFAPEENEGTIRAFLCSHPEFSVLDPASLTGVDPDVWGFAPGRPGWAEDPGQSSGSVGGSSDPGQSPGSVGGSSETGQADGACEQDPAGNTDPEIMDQLRHTVRLWPHLIKGEGHFAAVLRKADRPAGLQSGSEKGTEPAGDPPFSYEQTPEPLAVPSDQRRENLLSAGGGTAFRREGKSGSRSGNRKRDKRQKGKAGISNKKKQDPRLEEAVRLWRSFCQDTLQDIPDWNLFLFGDLLCALPLPADTLSLEGLRVLLPGLQLGAVVKGRFVPAHALGMALDREEVQHYVDLAGISPEAYAWIRGETVPVSPESSGTKGWCMVCIDGCSAGWGRAGGNMIKNHYPKGLRKGSSYRN